ncbi:MAG: site-specific DNA-methyltransferase [Candidatus Aminicenantes bacterium]|nr:site-specific DNA-methyltransferase [Candidatus Aminicenantes bacterium]
MVSPEFLKKAIKTIVKLTEQEKKKIIELIEAGKPLPVIYKPKLFDSGDAEYIEATKDYKLAYKGKVRKEDIIAQTPAAPFQKIRSFNSDNKFDDGWQNMLIFGDNLLALKTIYEDQRGPNIYKTKNRIKLIYIDPPFATKQDFMKDREKAYRDKIIGAQFIEFLRKRLILMKEILSDDGSIYVHLDWKKGHYIKAILDEVFGEYNFVNEIIWHYFGFKRSTSSNFPRKHDTIFAYGKSPSRIWNPVFREYSREYLSRWKVDENGELYRDDVNPTGGGTRTIYLKDLEGDLVESVWNDIPPVNPMGSERLNYPTQKPEQLLERIINASSNKGDIILDAFAGSGTTLAVAEKLSCRWIGIECGKLAIYTVQKRMINLTTQIGSGKKDQRRDYERVIDFEEHSKSKSRGLFFIYEKVRKGEFIITDSFLKDLADFISSNLSGDKIEEFSLVCPEEKLQLQKMKAEDSDGNSAGEKAVQVGRIKFLISFIQPKEKAEKEKRLKAKEFTLYHAGVYDNKRILEMPWEQYKPFVAQLFGLRPDPHKIHGLEVDGYIGVHSAYIWDYPNQKNLTLDREYVKTLHHVLGGKAGNRFYVVAPIIAMGFMEDEVILGDTTYSFLKVPLSILMALIEKGEPGSLKQPTSENDVNEVIDAIGFDFISQPEVKVTYHRRPPIERNLMNLKKRDYSIEITSFKSNTLVYDPEDFENFETLSMVLIDTNCNEDFFNLSKVFWAEQILNEEKTKAIIRIPEDEFVGKKMMVIFVDKYGNELKVIKTKKDFK